MPQRYTVVFLNKKLGTKFSTIVEEMEKETIADTAVTRLSEHLENQRVGSLHDYSIFSIKQWSEKGETNDEMA